MHGLSSWPHCSLTHVSSDKLSGFEHEAEADTR